MSIAIFRNSEFGEYSFSIHFHIFDCINFSFGMSNSSDETLTVFWLEKIGFTVIARLILFISLFISCCILFSFTSSLCDCLEAGIVTFVLLFLQKSFIIIEICISFIMK